MQHKIRQKYLNVICVCKYFILFFLRGENGRSYQNTSLNVKRIGTLSVDNALYNINKNGDL